MHAVALTTTSVEVVFSEVVDHASAEAAFTIQPAIEGAFSWSAATLVFTPAERLPLETDFVCQRCDPASATRAGNVMSEPHELAFVTVGNPTVVASQPEHDADDVPLASPIVAPVLDADGHGIGRGGAVDRAGDGADAPLERRGADTDACRGGWRKARATRCASARTRATAPARRSTEPFALSFRAVRSGLAATAPFPADGAEGISVRLADRARSSTARWTPRHRWTRAVHRSSRTLPARWTVVRPRARPAWASPVRARPAVPAIVRAAAEHHLSGHPAAGPDRDRWRRAGGADRAGVSRPARRWPRSATRSSSSATGRHRQPVGHEPGWDRAAPGFVGAVAGHRLRSRARWPKLRAGRWGGAGAPAGRRRRPAAADAGRRAGDRPDLLPEWRARSRSRGSMRTAASGLGLWTRPVGDRADSRRDRLAALASSAGQLNLLPSCARRATRPTARRSPSST